MVARQRRRARAARVARRADVVRHLLQVTGRDVRTIYTEHPALTRAWLAARADAGQARVVPLRGSTEGVIRADPHGGGVLLVTW